MARVIFKLAVNFGENYRKDEIVTVPDAEIAKRQRFYDILKSTGQLEEVVAPEAVVESDDNDSIKPDGVDYESILSGNVHTVINGLKGIDPKYYVYILNAEEAGANRQGIVNWLVEQTKE